MMNVRKFLKHWGALGGVLAVGLILTGCQTENSGPSFAEVPGPMGVEPAHPASDPVEPAIPVSPPVAQSSITPPRTVSDTANGFNTDLGNNRERIRVGDTLVVYFADLPVPVPPFE